MKKEIKYCLIGAIISGVITGTLIYFDVPGFITVLTKIVYIGFTLGLLYFVIRLLSTAETVTEGT
jgi:hypothetical protein